MSAPALGDAPWDVVVVGGGSAALVAALTARREVERVLVVVRAPRAMRGGNTRHTRNIRCAHDAADVYTPGSYPADELHEWDILSSGYLAGFGLTDRLAVS